MLTPYFEVSQTENTVFLVIKAPMANVKDAELIVQEEVLIFFSRPYYLRLNLPGKVVEDTSFPAKYDADANEFHFQMLKCSPGEEFKDLDMIAKLLVSNKTTSHLPNIQVCHPNEETKTNEFDDENADEEDCFFFDQEVVPPAFEESALPAYGFGLKYQSLTREIKQEFYELVDTTEVLDILPSQRTRMRETYEYEKFSDDHYAADFIEPEVVAQYLEYTESFDLESSFSHEEKKLLRKLGNKEFLLEMSEKRAALLGVADILFAYCYDRRTTLGESTVESAWTINKLSATLSWFEVFTNVKDVQLASFRRALSYPLFRHWGLCKKVVQDVTRILKSGRKGVLKCFCHIHRLFDESYPRYVLNHLYISDYCIWLQHISDQKVRLLGDAYEKVTLIKDDLEGFDLNGIEETTTKLQSQLQSAQEVSRTSIEEFSNDDSLDSDDFSSSSGSSADSDTTSSLYDSSEDEEGS